MHAQRLIWLFILSLVAAVVSAGATTSDLTALDFEKKIERGIALLSSDAPFSVEDATEFVRLSNTISFFKSDKTKLDEEFARLAWGRKFGDRLTGILGEAIPNKGMGLYFRKADLHWGGSIGNIRDRDRFVIAQ